MRNRKNPRWISTKIVWNERKSVGTLTLLIILVSSLSSINPVQSLPTIDVPTGVNYEGPYDWYYGLTNAEIGQDFQLFKTNNVNRIIINIIWSSIQKNVSPPSYNTQNIANIKRVLAKAEQYGISVCISFFQYWMNTTTGVPSWCIDPWTGNRRYIAIVRDRTIRGYFLEMIGDLVNEFKGSSAIECWSLLNEPMHSGSYNSSQLSTEREEFHLLIEEGSSVIHNRDNRPVTVKFTLPYSPWHTGTRGAYTSFVDFDRVMQSLDFMSINTFANPADYGTTRKWQGTTWSEFVQAVQDTKNAGYTFWVAEFGNNRGNETQRQHYQSAIRIFHDLGVDACFSWVWVHNGGAEPYNICYIGGLPKPAFYELNLQPPSISEITTSNIRSTTAEVDWLTNKLSNSTVVYGSTPSLGTTASDSALVIDHSLILIGLSEETVYYYEVQSTDTQGNTAVDNNGGSYYAFTTLPHDPDPPTITDVTGNTNGTTGEAVTIVANITDVSGVAEANVHYTGVNETETTIPMAKANSSDFWRADIPLAIDNAETITYHIEAIDFGQNIASDPNTGTYNITVEDNDAPTAEAGPNQTIPAGKTTNLDGSESTDNIGIVNYSWDFDSNNGIQEDATGMTASHLYAVKGTYTITLTVTDETGNSNTDTLEVHVTENPASSTGSSEYWYELMSAT